jgi:hypothetical protein
MGMEYGNFEVNVVNGAQISISGILVEVVLDVLSHFASLDVAYGGGGGGIYTWVGLVNSSGSISCSGRFAFVLLVH